MDQFFASDNNSGKCFSHLHRHHKLTSNLKPVLSQLLALYCLSSTVNAQPASGLPSINPRYAYSPETVERCAEMNGKLAKLSEQIEQSSQLLETDIAAFNQQSEALRKQQPELLQNEEKLQALRKQTEAKTSELASLRKDLETKYHDTAGMQAIDQRRDPQLIAYNKAAKAHRKKIQAIEDKFAAHQRASKVFNQASDELKRQAKTLNTRRESLNDDVFAYNKAIKLYNAQCQNK